MRRTAALSSTTSETPPQARDYRSTPQRRMIVGELSAARRYMTARELHGRLAAKKPRLGLATVYRTLEMLRSAGYVTAVRRNAETAYLFCRAEHHHHAVCTRCGRVQDVPCRSAERLERSLKFGLRFTVKQHRMEFFGLCARCS